MELWRHRMKAKKNALQTARAIGLGFAAFFIGFNFIVLQYTNWPFAILFLILEAIGYAYHTQKKEGDQVLDYWTILWLLLCFTSVLDYLRGSIIIASIEYASLVQNYMQFATILFVISYIARTTFAIYFGILGRKLSTFEAYSVEMG